MSYGSSKRNAKRHGAGAFVLVGGRNLSASRLVILNMTSIGKHFRTHESSPCLLILCTHVKEFLSLPQVGTQKGWKHRQQLTNYVLGYGDNHQKPIKSPKKD
eukprot:1999288-Amphidinium_carterae.1